MVFWAIFILAKKLSKHVYLWVYFPSKYIVCFKIPVVLGLLWIYFFRKVHQISYFWIGLGKSFPMIPNMTHLCALCGVHRPCMLNLKNQKNRVLCTLVLCTFNVCIVKKIKHGWKVQIKTVLFMCINLGLCTFICVCIQGQNGLKSQFWSILTLCACTWIERFWCVLFNHVLFFYCAHIISAQI